MLFCFYAGINSFQACPSETINLISGSLVPSNPLPARPHGSSQANGSSFACQQLCPMQDNVEFTLELPPVSRRHFVSCVDGNPERAEEEFVKAGLSEG